MSLAPSIEAGIRTRFQICLSVVYVAVRNANFISVLSVNHLKWQMSENVWRKAFEPCVKVNWIGPYLAVNQRTSLSQAQRTAVTVMTTELNTDEVWAPEFNKPFHL